MYLVRTYHGRSKAFNSLLAAEAEARNLLSLWGITDRAWAEVRGGHRLIETCYGGLTHRWVEVVAA